MTEPAPTEHDTRPDAAALPLDVHVVTHTHWDREWYHPAGRFRQRLVALVDELLDAPDGSFLLDGQAVVLADYLDVRPERREALAAALREGALEAGPWYVLADELIPSGEALVRNLLAGRRALREFGAEPPPVLYCPDSFGHPAALPAIARGFGLDAAVLWRGYGGPRWPDGDAARWSAPGGERVLLLHLPRDGYELGSNLPASDAEAGRRWRAMRAELAPRARLGAVLVQNGADHHARQTAHAAAIAALARVAAPDRVVRSSLRDYARTAAERAGSAALPEVRGELRDSYGYTWTLQGTFASRAAQKRRNALVERALLRESEPWAALAIASPATASEATAMPFAALLRAAWRTLLLCHPHDTLCGCSADEVARAMDARLDDALSQARGVADNALLAVIGHDAVRARRWRDAWSRALVVRNAAARPRAGVAEVELLTFLHHVPVGPGSAGAARRSERGRAAPVRTVGDAVPLQILERATRHDRVESPRHYPDDDFVETARAVAWVPDVAGYGTASWLLEERVSHAGLPDDVVPVTSPHENALANGLLELRIERDGAVRVASPALGWSVPSLVSFEDVGDVGDLYTHSPAGKTTTKAWFLGARVVHAGPLRGEIEARWRLRVPARRGATGEEGDDVVTPRGGRSAAHVELQITVRLTLDAGAPFVRVRVAGENRARYHRLRVVFATGVNEPRVIADAAFGPVERAPVLVSPEERAVEAPPATAPLHRYVSLYGAERGVTLFSDGLAEYEAGEDGRVAVTLLRAVGELSRAHLPERPGHAGWPLPTPLAQSLGAFEACFALFPHGTFGDDAMALVERTADDVLLPLAGETLRSALALPRPTLGIELEGDGLSFSSAKSGEDEPWIVLRCVNVTERAVQGRWRLGFDVADARHARLDETPLGPLVVERSREIPFDSGPRAIVTVLVRPRR
ncbi:MAG TPA: glycoside hydrolase family 38 C-terminal domain-containing protein [Gemmatimonadaceae bacterium]|nr:glycoside hydrolase family 38 C-terminal domain-containing protein [Gemmatimonadaceae bacterium]